MTVPLNHHASLSCKNSIAEEDKGLILHLEKICVIYVQIKAFSQGSISLHDNHLHQCNDCFLLSLPNSSRLVYVLVSS